MRRFWKKLAFTPEFVTVLVNNSFNVQQKTRYAVCFRSTETVSGPQWYVYNVSWEMDGRAQPFTQTSNNRIRFLFESCDTQLALKLSLLSQAAMQTNSGVLPPSSSQPQIFNCLIWSPKAKETFKQFGLSLKIRSLNLLGPDFAYECLSEGGNTWEDILRCPWKECNLSCLYWKDSQVPLILQMMDDSYLMIMESECICNLKNKWMEGSNIYSFELKSSDMSRQIKA